MGLYRRDDSPFWWYRFRFAGRPVRESAGTSDRAAAEQAEAKHKRELWEEQRLGVKPSRVWDDAVISYLGRLPEGRNKEQTKAELRWFTAHLQGKLLSRVDQNTLKDLQLLRAKGVRAGGKPLAPGTINRVMGIPVAVLHHAVTLGWLDHAPRLPKIPDSDRRIRYITREQAKALLLQLPAHQLPMVVFALETGLRRANVTHLRWEQVDVDRRLAWIHPDQAKAGKGISVPLSETAAEVLRLQRGRHAEWVFPYRGKPVYKTSTRAWHAALKRAGISDFRWHDLRHTWASWHRQDGTPTAVLKELGGWSDDRMPGLYAHLGVDHLAGFVSRFVGVDTKVVTAAAEAKQKKPVSG